MKADLAMNLQAGKADVALSPVERLLVAALVSVIVKEVQATSPSTSPVKRRFHGDGANVGLGEIGTEG